MNDGVGSVKHQVSGGDSGGIRVTKAWNLRTSVAGWALRRLSKGKMFIRLTIKSDEKGWRKAG